MTAEDNASAALIEANNLQLSVLAKSISWWRAKLNQTARHWDHKNSSLAAENARLISEHRNLQSLSQRRAKQQFLRLQHLCTSR